MPRRSRAGWKSRSSTGTSLPRSAADRRPVNRRRGGVVAAAQELHRVGDDIDCLALRPSWVSHSRHSSRPSIATGRPLDRKRAAVLALGAPDRDVEVVGLVLPLAGRAVLAPRVARRCACSQTEVPLGSERSSGSRVRLPVITTLLMLVAATTYLPFALCIALCYRPISARYMRPRPPASVERRAAVSPAAAARPSSALRARTCVRARRS